MPISGQRICPALRTKIADFPYYLTPELSDALDHHALEFLAEQGIRAEPVHYEPGTDFLEGLRLPGQNPDAVDLAALHRGIQAGLTLGRAAQDAGADLDTVRYLLACHPTPSAATDLNAYRRAKEAYPREAFIEQYELCGMSLAEIADQAGVSRQTVARLAADYQIETRKPGRATKYTVDPDWLYTQYVDHQRPLPDLARERGVSTTTMARGRKPTASRCAPAEAPGTAQRSPHDADDAGKTPRASGEAPGPLIGNRIEHFAGPPPADEVHGPTVTKVGVQPDEPALSVLDRMQPQQVGRDDFEKVHPLRVDHVDCIAVLPPRDLRSVHPK